MSRQLRLSSCFALATLAVLFAGGCAGTGGAKGDPIKDAQTVHRNLQRGEELMRDVSEYRPDDPSENMKMLPKLLQAEKLYQEARRLASDSSAPRLALGNCRALIGYVYYYNYLFHENEVRGAENAGRAPNPGDLEKRTENLKLATQWLKDSNRELEYYVNYLMPRYPKPGVYEQLSMNYEFLNNYAAAEEMVHRLMASTQLSREMRKQLEARAKYLRQKRLDDPRG